jgi:peptidoglycan/xylan/chitin deacetylase (PgdA/CDA1 family)
MTLTQIKALSQAGHEIGSHTVHHYDLTTLSLAQLRGELSQSLSYLQKKVTRSVSNFAYPYGVYSQLTDQEVRRYYGSARSSDEGLNPKAGFNVYNIRSEYITPQTTLSQFQSWLDEAKNQKKWLVLMYHQVDNSGSDYSVTPTMLAQQLQSLQNSGLVVKTVNQALAELKPQL